MRYQGPDHNFASILANSTQGIIDTDERRINAIK